MKLSVITVHYMDLEGLRRTSYSILNELVNAICNIDVEWIVVDGGTPDFVDFVEHLHLAPDRYVSEKDNGVYDAMNKGMDFSTGEFCIFLNAGDELAAGESITKLLGVLEFESVKLVYGNTVEVNIDGRAEEKSSRPLWWRYYATPTRQQSMIFQLQHLKNTGIRFTPRYRIAADLEFFFNYVQSISVEEVIRVRFPISKFYRGGLSYKNDAKVAAETLDIRRNAMRIPWLLNIVMTVCHDVMRKIRRG